MHRRPRRGRPWYGQLRRADREQDEGTFRARSHFAGKPFSWRQSGFSIESGTRIYDQEARQALSHYIVRPPLSLEKIRWDQEQDTVTWKSRALGYFRGREKHFSALFRQVCRS